MRGGAVCDRSTQKRSHDAFRTARDGFAIKTKKGAHGGCRCPSTGSDPEEEEDADGLETFLENFNSDLSVMCDVLAGYAIGIGNSARGRSLTEGE
jgi:hypothetical protein